jgi:hypothetical protein
VKRLVALVLAACAVGAALASAAVALPGSIIVSQLSGGLATFGFLDQLTWLP